MLLEWRTHWRGLSLHQLDAAAERPPVATRSVSRSVPSPRSSCGRGRRGRGAHGAFNGSGTVHSLARPLNVSAPVQAGLERLGPTSGQIRGETRDARELGIPDVVGGAGTREACVSVEEGGVVTESDSSPSQTSHARWWRSTSTNLANQWTRETDARTLVRRALLRSPQAVRGLAGANMLPAFGASIRQLGLARRDARGVARGTSAQTGPEVPARRRDTRDVLSAVALHALPTGCAHVGTERTVERERGLGGAATGRGDAEGRQCRSGEEDGRPRGPHGALPQRKPRLPPY